MNEKEPPTRIPIADHEQRRRLVDMAFNDASQLRNRRLLEDVRDVQCAAAELAVRMQHKPDRQQGVPTEREEIVLDAEIASTEQSSPHMPQPCFNRSARLHGSLSRNPLTARQRRTIDLAVDGEWK